MFFFFRGYRIADLVSKKSQEHLGLLDRFGGDLHLHLLDDCFESWRMGPDGPDGPDGGLHQESLPG